MSFYEVVYETGAHALLSGESDAQVLQGLEDHHRRALKGEVGGPTGHAAERVTKLFKYDKHPDELAVPEYLTRDEAEKRLIAVLDRVSNNDVVRVMDLHQAVVPQAKNPAAAPHESKFNVDPSQRHEVELPFLNDSNANPGGAE